MSDHARRGFFYRALFLSALIAFVILGATRSTRLTQAATTQLTPLIYDTTSPGSERNHLRLRLDGDAIELLDSDRGTVLTAQALASTSSIVINGSPNDDTLLVDFNNGNPIPAGGLTFNGGDQVTQQGDIVEIAGGSFQTAVYNYYNAHDGNIILDGSVINYTGLEPLTNTGTAANAIFNLPAGTVGALLQDDGTAGNNTVQLASTNATFETTTFTVPTNSLTVNGGGGTDTITTAANFSGDFNAALTINGAQATDAVTINNLTLGNAGSNPGSLTVVGNTITVSGAVNTTAGTTRTVTLTAGTSIQVNSVTAGNSADVNLTAGGGAVTGLITSMNPNDGLADVTGRTVTLTANGPSNGNTGQIGFFTVTAQFFEVAATTINAGTNNSRAWISAIGGAAIGSVNVGTNTVFLRTVNGNLTSTHVGSTPDVTAFTVNLSSVNANGSFGSSGSPLLLQASNLGAAITGTGSINATNVAAGGSLILTVATITNGVINLTVAGGALTVSNSGITSNNGAVTLTADNQDIQQAINAGTGIVTLQPFTNAQIINLGGADAAGTLGLTDTELGRVTAGVLRIGAFLGSGGITISSAITRHAGYNTLSLSNSGPGMITQTAALSVANLLVSSTTVTLTNAGNDVDTLAAATANCSYTDANALTIDIVDGQPESHANNDMVIVTGGTLAINHPLTSLNTRITLNAGGLVTEGIGGRIVAPNLQLLGTGQYNLGGSPTNDVTTIAANLTSPLVYIDANNLTVGTVNGTSGVTATNVVLSTVAGDLTVNQNINGAPGGVGLTAGSTPASPDHILGNIAAITGPGASLTADRMNLLGSINVGAGIATLRVASANRPINLDNTAGDPNGELRLSQTELNTITAGILRIGDPINTGALTFKSAIAAPAGWNTLSLLSAGMISEIAPGAVTVSNLRVTSTQGVQLNLVNNVGVVAGSATGALLVLNNGSNPLIVGVVDGTTGMISSNGVQLAVGNLDIQQAISAPNGPVSFFAAASVTQVDLGGADAPGTLGLTDAELDRVTATRLEIRSFTAAPITVTAPISQAGSGYNTLELNPQSGISTASGGGSLAVNNLIFTDGSGQPRTYNVNNPTSGANAFKENANASIPYSTTTSLTINGSTGNDIFNLAPSATTTFRMNGNGPTTAPGDTLNIDTTGTTITQFNRSNPGGASHDGNYMFSNRQPVFFTSIETLTALGGPTAAASTVAGTIVDADGKPVEGVVIRLNGSQNRKTITDANGNYHFDDVAANGFYSVTPARANYVFSPGSRAFSQLTDHTDAAFGASFTGDAFNPLDTPEYFVRQQYVDILGREPDEGGFNYWSDQILACGGDAVCNSHQRASVAAAFFIEQEFQQTGQFIYDAYSGTLGRRPAFSEYANDRQQVIGGPNLDAEKASFMQNFVQRAEVMQKYSDATTADSFVDSLLQTVQQNSGADLSSQRDALIARYQGGVDINQSRSLVLGDISSSETFKQAQYNRAFVLTEYFGYLQRDIDQGGYDFWLNVVNDRSPNNYRGMVCAFVTSAEYQKRFSTHVTHTNGECATVSEPKAVDASSVNSTKTRSN